MQSLQAWAATHAVLMTVLVWPIFTMIVNALFDLMQAHEAQSKALRFLDAALSAAGLDAGKLIAALKALFSSPPSAGPRPPRLDWEDQTPTATGTRPSALRMNGAFPKLHRALLAGVVMAGVVLAGCLPLRDALTLTKDEINCVMQAADDGLTTEQTALKCGIAATPDLLKLIEDLMTTEKAAHRSGVSWRKPDAGAK